MSVNLDKLVTESAFNSFKNNSVTYTGSVTFSGSVAAGAQANFTSSVTLNETPVFSVFFANFTEALDLSTLPNGTYGLQQWYPIDVGAFSSCGVWVTAPLAAQGVQGAVLYPVLNDKTLTVTGSIFNSTASNFTLGAVTVPYAFAIYTLAN